MASQKKVVRATPVLYITTGERYRDDGVLMKDECTDVDFWSELVAHKSIACLFIEDMTPFRIVMHKLERHKMHFNEQNSMRSSKYFALVWVPTTNVDEIDRDEKAAPAVGMTAVQYNTFIDAINEIGIPHPSRRNHDHNSHSAGIYFCRKLNKDCVYISGPEFGETQHDAFDLYTLKATCSNMVHTQELQRNGKELRVEIAVHELASEPNKTNALSIAIDTAVPSPANLADTDADTHEALSDFDRDEIKMDRLPPRDRLLPRDGTHSNGVYSSVSFGGVADQAYGPLPSDAPNAIYTKNAGLTRPRFVFAFVWLYVRDTAARNNHNNPALRPGHGPVADIDLADDVDDASDARYERPSWTVMKTLHKHPYKKSLVYNVELLNYNDCWENLDLVVDRKILWKYLFLVFLQFLCLPFFVVFPLRNLVLCFNPTFQVKPRYRPPIDTVIDFETDLEQIEQIPFDVTALWGRYHDKVRSSNYRIFAFKLVSLLMASFVWFIAIVGPFLYDGKPTFLFARDDKYNIGNLLFFDCYGVLGFSVLTMTTIVWWCCAMRIYFWPKEHELLFYKLSVHRPIDRKDEHNQNIRRTDWAALNNISTPKTLSTIVYAHKKGLLELKTPNQSLLSSRIFPCTSRRLYCIIFPLLYFVSCTLENWEVKKRPFYVATDVSNYQLKIAYNACAVLLSTVFVTGYAWLWETMFDRIRRHLSAVKTLSNLLTRNTYTEYMKLSMMDNILSWLMMEHFIKRKGMMLFSSLETPLVALMVMTVCSWVGSIYCIYYGVGQQLINEHSVLSNSALAAYGFSAAFTFYQLLRMLWFGRKFGREADKQQNAFKRSCKTLHSNNLMQYQINGAINEQNKYAMKSAQYILSHTDHTEIVPKVFGLQFDQLTCKTVMGLLLTSLPTIAKAIYDVVTS